MIWYCDAGWVPLSARHYRDISPENNDDIPLTKFVPWAAYLQQADGKTEILEQDEVFDRLCAQSTTNPSQLNLEQSIETFAKHREVTVRL